MIGHLEIGLSFLEYDINHVHTSTVYRRMSVGYSLICMYIVINMSTVEYSVSSNTAAGLISNALLMTCYVLVKTSDGSSVRNAALETARAICVLWGHYKIKYISWIVSQFCRSRLQLLLETQTALTSGIRG